MKQKLLSSFRLRVVMLVAILCSAFTGTVWGADTEVIFDFTNSNNYQISTSDKTITYGETVFSYTVTGTDNCQKQSGIQWGASKTDAGTITIMTSAFSGYVIKKVDIQATSTAGYNAAVSVGSTSYTAASNNSSFSTTSHTNSYTGSSSGTLAITLSQSATKKNVIVQKITITYSSSGSGGSLTTSDLAITGEPVALSFDLYNNNNAQTVSYTTSSTGAVTVSESEYVTTTVDATNKTITVTPVKKTPSAQTITVSQAADDTYAAGSATFTVSVVNSNEPGSSAANPYTVAQANAATPASGTSANVYIHGIVSGFYGTNTDITGDDYHRYYISDDGTSTDQLLVFNGKGLNNVAFSNADDLMIGDEITICGGLTTFSNAPEVAKDNYIVSLTRKEVVSIALSGTYTTTFVEGSEFNHDGVLVTATYTDNSTADVTSLASFSAPDMSQVGTQDVTVSFGGKTATYTITVTEAPTHTATFSVNGTTSTQDFKEGTAITFPADPADISDYKFMGWMVSEINGTQSSAPTYVTSVNMGSEDICFYAVFAKGEEKEVWKKIGASAVSEGGTYAIITSGGRAFNGTINDGHGASTTDVFSFDDNNNAETAPTGTCELTFVSSGSGFTMYKEGLGYLYASKASSGGLAWHQTESDYWLYDNENWIYNKSYSSNKARLRVYNNTFRTYSANNNDPIYFAHKTTISSVSDFCTTVPSTTATITLNAACTDGDMVYGTYSNTSAFVVSNDIVVAEVGIVDGKLYVEPYSTGAVVPANTGVMVSAMAGGEYVVNLSNETGTSVLGTDNRLRPTGDAGITAADMANADANCVYYRLTMHGANPSNNEPGTIGYWWGAAEGAAFAVAANKAYLAVSKTDGARISGFAFDEDGTTTAIEDVRVADGKNAVYNLNGQRVAQPQKGMYIVNGKKVIK